MAKLGVYGAGQIYRGLGARKERKDQRAERRLDLEQLRRDEETRRLNEQAKRLEDKEEREREFEEATKAKQVRQPQFKEMRITPTKKSVVTEAVKPAPILTRPRKLKTETQGLSLAVPKASLGGRPAPLPKDDVESRMFAGLSPDQVTKAKARMQEKAAPSRKPGPAPMEPVRPSIRRPKIRALPIASSGQRPKMPEDKLPKPKIGGGPPREYPSLYESKEEVRARVGRTLGYERLAASKLGVGKTALELQQELADLNKTVAHINYYNSGAARNIATGNATLREQEAADNLARALEGVGTEVGDLFAGMVRAGQKLPSETVAKLLFGDPSTTIFSVGQAALMANMAPVQGQQQIEIKDFMFDIPIPKNSFSTFVASLRKSRTGKISLRDIRHASGIKTDPKDLTLDAPASEALVKEYMERQRLAGSHITVAPILKEVTVMEDGKKKEVQVGTGSFAYYRVWKDGRSERVKGTAPFKITSVEGVTGVYGPEDEDGNTPFLWKLKVINTDGSSSLIDVPRELASEFRGFPAPGQFPGAPRTAMQAETLTKNLMLGLEFTGASIKSRDNFRAALKDSIIAGSGNPVQAARNKFSPASLRGLRQRNVGQTENGKPAGDGLGAATKRRLGL